jgi:hypothetical protein
MGEMADDIISGKCCALCGQFFVQEKNDKDKTVVLYEHGYPVACADCWAPNCGYEPADDEVEIL